MQLFFQIKACLQKQRLLLVMLRHKASLNYIIANAAASNTDCNLSYTYAKIPPSPEGQVSVCQDSD